jgi:YD repeat-containing protein
VFASNREGDTQIFVMNADGSGLVRLTYSGAHDDNPRWSPNGTKILFQSDRDNATTGYMDIYVMNANGGGVTRLTANVNDNCLANWSPDGTKIVFESLRNGTNYQIYTMNADGSNQVNLTYTSSNDTEPSWSPDGSKIAFASDRDHSGYADIYVMSANGSGQTRLTFVDAPYANEQPSWSRDGSKIAFASTRDSILEQWQETDDFEIPEDDGQIFNRSLLHVNKEVYVMNANGFGQTRLTNELANDEWPSWSPDGSKIVFTSDRERENADPTPQVWTMNADGTGLVNISSNGAGEYSASWTSGSSNQIPVANAGGMYSGIIAQNVPFHGNGSFDPDDSIVSFAWTFGDGGTGSGVGPTHAYTTTGTYNVTLTVTDNQGAQGYASTTVTISSSSSDQYAVNFLQQGLGRSPSQDESTYWTDIIRSAYAQGQSSMLLAMTEFGMTVFESAEYASHGRGDHEYVYDLYKTYLMREPDADGWDYWTTQASPLHMGRAQVRNAFESAGEYQNIVATLTASGSPSAAVSSLATAQVDRFNQSGNQVQARDCEWTLPLVSLPGRAGLDLGLSISYSSLVWTRSGPYIYFDQDNESLSPGFTIGFPTVQWKKFDAQTGRNVYVFTAAGRHVELRQVGTTSLYESADSSYLQLTEGGSLSVRSTDGTEILFENKAAGWRAKQIEDRNGNIISITNDWRGDIQTVVDTLGRTIYFSYDGNSNLTSIKQDWAGQSQAHTWATFDWGNPPSMQLPSGVQAVGTYASESVPVVTQVNLPGDDSHYHFEYNAAAQVNLVRKTSGNLLRSQTVYNYGASDDTTRLSNMRASADNWTSTEFLPASYVETQFNLEGAVHTVTVVGDPSGTVYKESYGTGWQKGLVTATETWGKKDPEHSVERQRWTTTSWVQDDSNPNALYRTNPRVVASDVSDNSNHAHTEIGYQTFTLPYTNASCSLPNEIYEYDGSNVLRRTHTDYNLDSPYLNHRIIGLLQAKLLYEGTSVLRTKTTYVYDWIGEYPQALPAAPTQHDGSYSTDFVAGRGNLVAVQRWDADYPTDANKVTQNTIAYDITGNVIFARDALNHQNSISYADAFSDGNTRNTFAYPTMIKDADWNASTAPNNYSTVKYNFDHGGKTRVQGPPPGALSEGAIQTLTYDEAIRPLQITTLYNGAYVRYIYGPNNVVTLSTVNQVADEAYSNTVFDGFGRTVGVATNHPGSTGGYKAQWTVYDLMGRVSRQYNPTEIDGSWNPAGDDVAGRIPTTQTYDWKGRPLETRHVSDGTSKYANYDGCGCAGGEVVTLTDEVGRREKVYSDVLGRQWKAEVLNDNGTVYSTTTNTFNARDQVTLVRQTDNATGVYQETTMGYDGYGRLISKHVPEQRDPNGNPTYTNWAYKIDDAVESITDGRGASATYIYNNSRHLVNEVHYSVPSGVAATANATFGYDAAGNRTAMTDGSGSMNYSYDQLSRLTSETKTFTGVGSYTLNYGYNLAGEITSIGLPFYSQQIDNSYDNIGRLSGVTGSGFNATYYAYPNQYTQSVPTFASNIHYRAWGARGGMSYGNNVSEATDFNTRMQPISYALTNTNYTNTTIPGNPNYTSMSWSFDYYNDGRLNHAWDTTNNWFDRAYSYDHVGRLSESTSYRRAEGLTPFPSNPYPDPYQQTNAYDVWGNITSRSGALYASPQSDSATYSNNRRSGWSYDADGNTITDASYNHSLDAASKDVHAASLGVIPVNGQNQPVLDVNQTYDGDGQPRIRLQTMYKQGICCDENGNPSEPVVDTKQSYYVRSSVLGGAVIADIGQGEVYIYAGGERIAKANGSVNITFEHHNPTTGSWVTTHGHSSYRTTNREERDAFGAELPLSTPYGGSSYVTSKFGELLFIEGGDPFDYSSGLTIDGMPVSASEFARLAEAGGLSVEIYGPGIHGTQAVVSLGVGIYGYDRPRGWHRDEEGINLNWEVDTFSLTSRRFAHAPQKRSFVDFGKVQDCAKKLFGGVDAALDWRPENGVMRLMFKPKEEDSALRHVLRSKVTGDLSPAKDWIDISPNFEKTYQQISGHNLIAGMKGGTAAAEPNYNDQEHPYLANDVGRSNETFFALFVHEAGVALGFLTGKTHKSLGGDLVYDDPSIEPTQEQQKLWGHNDAGVTFEDCVFGRPVSQGELR